MKKMKTMWLVIMSLVMTACIVSCNDDDNYEVIFPTWRGFKINTNTVKRGDTLRINMPVEKGGQNLMKTSYTWTMQVDTLDDDGVRTGTKTLTYKIASKASRPIHMNDEPKAYFAIPMNAIPGTANRQFTFKVNYDNCVQCNDVYSYTQEVQSGYLGKFITCSILSQLYSSATANFSTSITIE